MSDRREFCSGCGTGTLRCLTCGECRDCTCDCDSLEDPMDYYTYEEIAEMREEGKTP